MVVRPPVLSAPATALEGPGNPAKSRQNKRLTSGWSRRLLRSRGSARAFSYTKKGHIMIAYCGLNCSKCDAYLATKEDNEAKRKETAQKWSLMYRHEIRSEQIHCDGCKATGLKFFHCNNCDIRKCCTSKGIEHCAACEEYVCETLAGFIKLAPEAGIALEKLR